MSSRHRTDLPTPDKRRIQEIGAPTCAALVLLLAVALASPAMAQGTGTGAYIGYHEILVDNQGMIIPWYSADPGTAYDHDIGLVWNWWKNRELCPNGVKYYMQHQVWVDTGDDRGLGGDQLAMALSSWRLLYAYSGDSSVVDNMVYIADYYIAHSLSSSSALWANLPYPYNTVLHSGTYDGDMMAGVGFTQPDKAGSFAFELLGLYKITGYTRYLTAAVNIANTLAARIVAGDATHSPWPFRVNATTGEVNAAYTANYAATLSLFDELIRLNLGTPTAYDSARTTLSTWMKTYPMSNNQWGPFFEDVGGDSITETNADTMAMYILEHPSWDASWQAHARSILDWSYSTFGNTYWAEFGAIAINEQTAYMEPGNSHTSRHWSVELLYAEKTGDVSRKAQAIRGLNWATYFVDVDGKNRYPTDAIWLTDGYGDYVRHYLRAMAADPELSPAGQSHLLRTTSVVTSVAYGAGTVSYTTYDAASREVLRLGFSPTSVTAGGVSLPRLTSASQLDSQQGYVFEGSGDPSGVLRVRHDNSGTVVVSSVADTIPPAAVADLAAGSPSGSTIALTWTAPGADGSTGTASQYDIRYRTGGAVTDANWGASTGVTGEPAPASAGTTQSMVVSGLSTSTTYYFALKTADASLNWSAISNSPSAATTGPDLIPPAAVTNLAAINPTTSTVTLVWTAPGDSGYTGTATRYDLRYRVGAPLTDSNWASSTQIGGPPTPGPAGSAQTMVVSGLPAGTTYYFALKTVDAFSNWSALSNSPGAATPPVTTVGYTGDGTTSDDPGASYINAFRSRAGSGLTVTAIHVRLAAGAAGRMKLAIYSDSNGSPGSFLRGTQEKTGLAAGWQRFTLTTPLTLTSGAYYWLAIWTNDAAYLVSANAETNGGVFAAANYGGAWPSSFPSGSSQNNFRYSLFAVAASANTAPNNIFVTATNQGQNLLVTWEPGNCAPAGYHILYGYGPGLPSWTLAGAVCSIGRSWTFAWNSTPDLLVSPPNLLWFMVVGDDGSSTEGSWGSTSSGLERGGSTASGLCGMTTKSTLNFCTGP